MNVNFNRSLKLWYNLSLDDGGGGGLLSRSQPPAGLLREKEEELMSQKLISILFKWKWIEK